MGVMLDAMLFTSFMHMMMPPPIMIVSPMGAPLGHVSDVQANPDLASDANVEAQDHGHGHANDGAYQEAADHGGADAADADQGGADEGWEDGGWDGGDDGSWI